MEQEDSMIRTIRSHVLLRRMGEMFVPGMRNVRPALLGGGKSRSTELVRFACAWLAGLLLSLPHMKRSNKDHGSKGITRALVRRGARSSKAPRVAQKRSEALHEPTICGSCGAIFLHRTWRRRALEADRLDGANWGTCPACEQVRRGEYYGRVVATDATHLADRDAIIRRIRNVARRSGFTQPERRLVSIDCDGSRLEVLSTSQKLAHRIACELVKAFGGRASFRWSGKDGSLLATWKTER
jgi:hypothetical protein